MNFQKRMKERRNALNLTLLQVAEQLGVSEATVQRYESGGIKNLKHETVMALSEILKCSPAYLMGWDEDCLPEFRKTNFLPFSIIYLIKGIVNTIFDGNNGEKCQRLAI